MEEPTQERDACLLARRQRTASETPQERDACLLAMRQRTASETPQERDARLLARRQRTAFETPQERDARLLARRQRTASETPQERETRHRRMRLSQQQHRASQTPHDTEARRQQDEEYHRRQTQINSAIPLHQQPGVRSKIKTFHMRLYSCSAGPQVYYMFGEISRFDCKSNISNQQ